MPLRLLVHRLLREEDQCIDGGPSQCPEALRCECSVCGAEWDSVNPGKDVCCPSCNVRFGRASGASSKLQRCLTCPMLPIERIRNTTPEGKLLGRVLEMEVDVQLGIADFKDVNFEERECLRIIHEERRAREREQMDERRVEHEMAQLQAQQERKLKQGQGGF